MKLVLASNNKNKIIEIKQLLNDLNVEVISQREAGCNFDAEETGTTFAENAKIKAIAAYKATGLSTIADDSGLMVKALNGEPGVYSARYTGNHEDSDEIKNNFLLSKLDGIVDRRAKYVCSICCILDNGDEIICQGECLGNIGLSPKGNKGFGYDPIFIPDGYDETMAELGDIKQKISHRAKALEKFKNMLEEYVNGVNK